MKNIFLILLACFLVSSVEAQNIYNSSGRKVARRPVKKKGFDRDKFLMGGDFRLSLGSQISVGISPMIGYKLTDKFCAGIRLGYSYDRLKYDYSQLPAGARTNVFNFNAYAAGVWARYLFWESIYVHTEVEYNIFDEFYQDDYTGLIEKRSINSPSVMVGLGLRQPINDRVSFNATLLYDVLNDPYGYYKYKGGFDLRFGILVGF